MADPRVRPLALRNPRPRVLLRFLLALLAASALVASPAWAGEGDDIPITRDVELAAQHFDEAEVFREEFKWGEAATAYWKALEADLEHYVAHVRYQETALRAGDPLAEIKNDYSRFVEDYAHNVCMKLHRFRLDPPAERLPKLEALRKQHGKNFNVYLEIGRTNLALDQAVPAVSALERALALKTGSRDDVVLLLATAHYAAGHEDKAYQQLDLAVKAKPAFWSGRLTLARWDLLAGRYEQGVQHADIVVQQRPTYIGAFLVKSEALSGAGKPEEAKDVLKAVYERITQDVPEVTIALADLTAKFETEVAFKEATALYKKVLEKDDENARAMYGLAWVLERQKKYEEAEEKYREVLVVQPNSVDAVNSVGFCLYKQGRVTEAQVQFKRALDMKGEMVTALLNLGATYDAQAKYPEAIKIYEKVLKLPGQKDNMRAIINAAFDYESLGTFPKATKLLQRAHELAPKDPNIMVWLGDNYYFQKKLKEAERWYQEAIALDEKLFFAWRGLGFTLAQRKRWADAAAALENAKKLKPDDLEMYALLGDMYWDQLKDLQSALDNYQEYMQRGGTDPEIQEAIIEIKKELEKKK